MSEQNPPPSPTASNGDSGRAANGRFLAGNRAAKGNPLAQKAQQLRAAMFRAVTSADLRAVVKRLVEAAKAGDTAAAKLVLDRTLGPPQDVDFLERLERIESALEGRKEQ